MACKICGRNNCIESFHSIEEQEKHEELFGAYETKIENLKTEIEKLRNENRIMWDILDNTQREAVEKELAELAQ